MESGWFRSKGTSYFACTQGGRWVSEPWKCPTQDGRTRVRGNGPSREGAPGGWEPVLVYLVLQGAGGLPSTARRVSGCGQVRGG